jgi:hypothetical protein
MTIDERLDRIEHLSAGLAEERCRDRQADRDLWRDTQRQLNELIIKVAAVADGLYLTAARIAELAEEAATRDRETDRRFRETDRCFRETDERIEKMTSAMGNFIRAIPNQPNPQAS